ncbi:hypothetical protein ACH40E_01700 [Streptomyces acidicola]|uniref:hypothetical protein n=1 Tax=Streptomyces acidicola TaxID=2596892 RepID=UPI0037B1DDE7
MHSLLAATAADVPAQLAAFEGAVRSSAAIGARGERREASLLLGQHVGRVDLARHQISRRSRTEQLRGEAALVLGTCAMACGRDAAAHGFSQGITAYRTLVGEFGPATASTATFARCAPRSFCTASAARRQGYARRSAHSKTRPGGTTHAT